MVLGFDPENVIDVRDATQVETWSTFGSWESAKRSDLWSYLDPGGGSDVVVFYSPGTAPRDSATGAGTCCRRTRTRTHRHIAGDRLDIAGFRVARTLD